MNGRRLAYAQALPGGRARGPGTGDAISVPLVAAGMAAGSWSPALLATSAQITWWLGISIASAGIAALANTLASRMRLPEGKLAFRSFGHAAQFRSANELLAKGIGTPRNSPQQKPVRVGKAAPKQLRLRMVLIGTASW